VLLCVGIHSFLMGGIGEVAGREVVIASAGTVGADSTCRSGLAKGIIFRGSVSTHTHSQLRVNWITMSM